MHGLHSQAILSCYLVTDRKNLLRVENNNNHLTECPHLPLDGVPCGSSPFGLHREGLVNSRLNISIYF